MKKLMLASSLLTVFLSACGSGSNIPIVVVDPEPTPRVDISGPSTVWSDEYEWSATASSLGLDISTVGFTMSGGDESITIDSITGEINIDDYSVDVGSHRFIISATDASGTSASTTYSLRSDAFIAGFWYDPNSTNGASVLLVTRSGNFFSQIYNEEIARTDRCFGSFAITGSDLDGETNCRSSLDGNFLADVQAIANRYDITLNKTTITAGDGIGTVDDEPTTFKRQSNPTENIVPGRYLSPGSSSSPNFFEVIINADGSFNTLPVDEMVSPYTVSTCQVSGNIIPDPIYGLATDSSNFNARGDVYDSTFSATGCTDDFNQSMTDAIVYPSVLFSDFTTPTLFFGTPGNPESNGGYNATELFLLQLCDEQEQTTELGLSIGLQANCTAPASGPAYGSGLSNPDMKRVLNVLGQGFGPMAPQNN